MTQKEILKYNKRCAEFIGCRKKGSMYYFDAPFRYTMAEKERLDFHSDWNWIMGVVEAISTKFGKAPLFQEVYLKWLNEEDKNREDFLIFTLPKKTLVEAINQFLIWHEKDSKS